MLTLEHSFVKVLEQMSVINFMNYSLSTAAEGFVPSHAPLKNNKHLNIPFQSTQLRRGKNKSELQDLTPSSQARACGTRRGSWGHASILSVMPDAAPDTTAPALGNLLQVLREGQVGSVVRYVVSWDACTVSGLSTILCVSSLPSQRSLCREAFLGNRSMETSR